jgi:predicted membrane-bound spermidine synthase
VLTAALFLTSPSSTIIKTTISHWTPDTFYTVSSSLPDAGKFIGYLERVMVFTFILYGRWEAVGFLLAAKSVFRFGNLKESHDRKLTEYVLIGTLLSFGIAIAIALLSSALIGQPVE